MAIYLLFQNGRTPDLISVNFGRNCLMQIKARERSGKYFITMLLSKF